MSSELLEIPRREPDCEDSRSPTRDEVCDGTDTPGREQLDLTRARPERRALGRSDGKGGVGCHLGAQDLMERVGDGASLADGDDDAVEIAQHDGTPPVGRGQRLKELEAI